MLMTRRLCKEDKRICKDSSNTKVEGLFKAVQLFFKEKYVMLDNISCATSKAGKYKEFLAITSHVCRKS